MSARWYICFLSAMMCSWIASAQRAGEDAALLPYQVHGSFGYISRLGNAKLEPRFEQAARFSEGLAAVQVNNRWGYIDAAGAMKIAARFDDARSFSEDRAVVRIDQANGVKYFYIDRTGKAITRAGYDEAHGFSEGFAAVKLSGKWFYIDRSGTQVFGSKAAFDSADDFSGGLAHVSARGRHGFIDTAGKLAVSPRFKSARSFSGHLAAVQTDNDLWGYIDQNGDMHIQPQFESAGDFCEDLAPVRLPGDSRRKGFGFIDKEGKLLIDPQFASAHSFSEGLALVAVPDPYVSADDDTMRWGFINKHGGMLIPPHFLEGEDFHDGVARVVAATSMRGYYLDHGAHLIAPVSDRTSAESAGVVNGYGSVPLHLESTPSGAQVYLVPLFDWETDPNLHAEAEKLDSDTRLGMLSLYLLSDSPGITPIVKSVRRQTYVILFKLGNKVQTIQKAVHVGELNSITATFP